MRIVGVSDYRDKLITGGFGLIGSSFKHGDKIGRHDVDLSNSHEVENYFHDKFYDVVIHCASLVGGLPYNIANPDIMYKVNSEIFNNSYKYINHRLFVNFSSTCVFPNKLAESGTIMTESAMFYGAPHDSNIMYAFAKRESTSIINQDWIRYKLEGLDSIRGFTVIPCNVYGLNDTFDVDKGHVIPALISKFYNAIKTNTDVVIWGDGTPLRQFIFANDLANIVDILITKNTKHPSVIIAPDDEYSIGYIVDIIADIFSYDGKIIYDKTKPNGQFRKTVSNELLKSIIGDYKFTSIYDGLKLTIDNYINLREQLA